MGLPEDIKAEVEEDRQYQEMLDRGMVECKECHRLQDPAELVDGRCTDCRCQICGDAVVQHPDGRFYCIDEGECGAVYTYNNRTRAYEFIGYNEDIVPFLPSEN